MALVAYLKSPKKNNTREPVYFATHADFVEGLTRLQFKSFTVESNAWTKNPSEASKYVYYTDIAVTGLTADDYAEVNFNRASQSVLTEANLCPSGETIAGKIRLYAELQPTDSISGECVIIKNIERSA